MAAKNNGITWGGVVKGVAKVVGAVTVVLAVGLGVGAGWEHFAGDDLFGINSGLAKVAGAVGASVGGLAEAGGSALEGLASDAYATGEPVTGDTADRIPEERMETLPEGDTVADDPGVKAAVGSANEALEAVRTAGGEIEAAVNGFNDHLRGIADAAAKALEVRSETITVSAVENPAPNIPDSFGAESTDIDTRADIVGEVNSAANADALEQIETQAEASVRELQEALQAQLEGHEGTALEKRIDALNAIDGVSVNSDGQIEISGPSDGDDPMETLFEKRDQFIEKTGALVDAHDDLVSKVSGFTEYTEAEQNLGKAVIAGGGAATAVGALAHSAGKKEGQKSWAQRVRESQKQAQLQGMSRGGTAKA